MFKYFQDPDLPFDQTLLKVDPNLRYSELMTVINAFSNAFTRAKKEPKLSFIELASRRGRLTDRGNERAGFFRGSELPRLLVLAAIMVVGWGLVWQFLQQRPQPAEPEPRSRPGPSPSCPTARSSSRPSPTARPMSFRDNAAYAYLLEKARARRPAELAAESRRDIALTHLWERPELYRGVPVHLLGTAHAGHPLRVEAEPDGLALRGLDRHPRRRKLSLHVRLRGPAGRPSPRARDVSERVVFNGYFLKIMKYQAGDVARGAPVLVGKLGWDPAPDGGPYPAESNNTLFWSLVILGGTVLHLPGPVGLPALPLPLLAPLGTRGRVSTVRRDRSRRPERLGRIAQEGRARRSQRRSLTTPGAEKGDRASKRERVGGAGNVWAGGNALCPRFVFQVAELRPLIGESP